MDLPHQFGEYELLERIATGGMAEVFLARAFGVEGFQKRLVIKRILPSLARSERFVSMFVKEAKISSLLSHPNIVQVFDLGRVGSDHYIAMEHIHGRDLTRTVKRLRAQGRGLPIGLAVHIGACLARGLAYAHHRTDPGSKLAGIIHRDVSPHNVVVSFEGEVKLLDFGIARLAGEAEPGVGRPGGGKFAYMSPEQARGEPVDHRTDIFACGIVLYELLVNHRLFAHSDPDEKLRLVREAVVPDPREENPEVPDSLWFVLQRALARDTDDRYSDAGTLEEDLRALIYSEGLRGDDAALGAFVRDLWAEELGPDPAVIEMEEMVRGLGRAEGSTATGTDDSDRLGASVDSGSGSGSGSGSDSGDGGLGRVAVSERKPVAVLALELLGLTVASATLDPEALVRRYARLQRAVERVARRDGAWVEQQTDEAFTLVFGVPKTQEEDLERACHAACALQRAIGRLRRQGEALELACGVHLGEVVMTGQADDWSCLPRGDALKLARRLALVAEPGTVVVSAEVVARASALWRFAAGPQLRQQGHREETPCFRVEGRRRRAQSAHPVRWLPRSDEVERLTEGLSVLARGKGGLIVVRGETGCGKSLLLRELDDLADRAGLPMFKGRTQPYGSDRPLTPFRELVADMLGIEADAEPASIRASLARLAELRLSERDAATLAYLFALELHPSKAPPRQTFFEVGLRLVRGIARERPVLLALEDVHYLDRVERELLRHLLRNTTDDPILWLLSWSGDPGIDLGRDSSVIRLSAMDAPSQRRLVCELAGAESCSEELAVLVAQASGGNPLYVEEVIKALTQGSQVVVEQGEVDLAGGVDAAALPPTLEGFISARIDALDAASKGVIQLAATIGMTFNQALLGQAAGLDDPGPLIDDLVDQGLLVAEGGEGRYAFASYLVWEVVRSSILGVQLRDHHRMVAAGMERLWEGRLEPHLESLASHCAQGGRLIDAARYAQRAGDLHRRASFLERALAAYRRAIRWLEAAEPEPESSVSVGRSSLADRRDGNDDDADLRAQGEAILNHRAGEVAALLGRYRLAERHYQVALELASDFLLAEVEGRCHLGLAELFGQQGSRVLASAHVDQALSQARISRDVRRQVEALTLQASLALQEGDLSRSQAASDEAHALAEELEDPRLAAAALVALANLLMRASDEGVAQRHLERARVLADQAEDRILVGRVINNLGLAHLQSQRLEQALACFREAMHLRRDTGYRQGRIVNLHNIGDVLLRMGRPGRAWAAFERSRDAAREVGLDKAVAYNDVYLGYLQAERGEDAEGLALLADARERAGKLDDRDTVVLAHWLEGRALLNAGRLGEARQRLAEGLRLAGAQPDQLLVRDIQATLRAFPDAVQ